MRISLSPRLVKIAHLASKIPGIKPLLKPVYYRYKRKIDNNRNSQFLAYGLITLKEFDQVMKSNNISYALFAGTLLGAIREQGFLKHDLDIDTVMFNDSRPHNLVDILAQKGFKLHHSFEIDDGKKGREETYVKNNVTIDIYYVYNDNLFPTYQCDFHCYGKAVSWKDSMKKYGRVETRRIEFPISRETKDVPFESIKLPVLQNAEEWLCCRYGSDYMIPNPSFRDDGSNLNMFIWKDVVAIYKEF